MTAEQRQQLRRAVDEAVRARIAWDAEPRCAGCGVELFDPISELPRYLDGCRHCGERRRVRELRAARRPRQLALAAA